MNNAKKNLISIVSQAFYGNRTATEVDVEKLDRFIIGYLDDFPNQYPVDRTIVKVPNTDNIVIIYNNYREEERRAKKAKVFREEGYVIEPLAVIPEENIEIYSRCIACRMNADGELESLQDEDYDKLTNYLVK